MESLYTNSSSRHDFFNNAFISTDKAQCAVFIAVAFFTHSEPLLNLIKQGCRIKMIVRLGYPTNPTALQDILSREGIQIRFVNDRSFHPKLYIFTGLCAIVGSSNLTESALKTNQEVNVSIDIEDTRYSELISLFSEWWDQSKVLDHEALDEYRMIYEKYRKHSDTDTLIEDDMQKKQGRVTIKNIERGLKKPSASEIYLDDYKSIYQGFLDAYITVERIYKEIGKRKYNEDIYPLRLEIDSYFSFVRENRTVGDSYKDEPLLKGQPLENRIRESIIEWLDTDWPWLDNEIIPKRYPTIKKFLGSSESIDQATVEDLAEALSTCHSFYDRLRFFKGGHDAHIKAFVEGNDIDRIKKTLTYLLYGKDEPIKRMARCIFDSFYKLNHFGRSNVQELLGWVNNKNIPICNNRTLRALRWLGFDVVLVGG
jgi:hypothetical protein